MLEAQALRIDRPEPSEQAKYQQPWVPYPAGVEALRAMAQLIKRPREGRQQNLAIIGGPNYGKSHLLDRFVDCYPDITDVPIPRIQVLSVETPPKADGAALLRELMSAMGARFNARSPLDELLRMFCVRAESLQILMFVIDEFNNGAWGRREASTTLVHVVRAISNRLGRPIVIAGIPALEDVLRNDTQLNERFRRIVLPKWSRADDVRNLLATFEASLSMPTPSQLDGKEITEMVMNVAGPKLGRIAALLREAHRIAVAANADHIAKEHLLEAAPLLVGSAGE